MGAIPLQVLFKEQVIILHFARLGIFMAVKHMYVNHWGRWAPLLQWCQSDVAVKQAGVGSTEILYFFLPTFLIEHACIDCDEGICETLQLIDIVDKNWAGLAQIQIFNLAQAYAEEECFSCYLY